MSITFIRNQNFFGKLNKYKEIIMIIMLIFVLQIADIIANGL